MTIREELILSCKKQNRAAQKELYELLLPYLRAIANRYLRDVSYVKDVLQESFVKIFKSIHNYDAQKASFKSWASKIVVNCSLNYNKRVIGTPKETLDDGIHDVICFPQVVRDLSDEHLLFILKKMPAGYFEVFNLFVIDGYKHDEIASMLEIPSSLSRKRLSRAREWLKKHLEMKQNLGHRYTHCQKN